LGSVGNLAQAVVVAEGLREDINENAGTSNEALDDCEDYESDGHYAVVDESILRGRKSQSGDNDYNSTNVARTPPVEAIYSKVNKKRKPQVHMRTLAADDWFVWRTTLEKILKIHRRS
jgi:hypothetical protein